jgi:hypothetical protein
MENISVLMHEFAANIVDILLMCKFANMQMCTCGKNLVRNMKMKLLRHSLIS